MAKSRPPRIPDEALERSGLLHFILPLRINRFGFFWRVTLWHLLFFSTNDFIPTAADLSASLGLGQATAGHLHTLLYVIVILSLLAYGILYVFRPRLRDCGLNPWLLALILAPYVSIIVTIPLLFQPSKTWQPGHK